MENWDAFIMFRSWVLRKLFIYLFMFCTSVYLLITYSLFWVFAQLKVAELHVLASSCLAECKSLKTSEWILMKIDIGELKKKIIISPKLCLKMGKMKYLGSYAYLEHTSPFHRLTQQKLWGKVKGIEHTGNVNHAFPKLFITMLNTLYCILP